MIGKNRKKKAKKGNVFTETYRELTEPFRITPINFIKCVIFAAALGIIITMTSLISGYITLIAAALLFIKEVVAFFTKKDVGKVIESRRKH